MDSFLLSIRCCGQGFQYIDSRLRSVRQVGNVVLGGDSSVVYCAEDFCRGMTGIWVPFRVMRGWLLYSLLYGVITVIEDF